jgi:alkanesulfonate monooxygenase SsuD/methylene tetrahydromethanopterin reductase-like flavin-dependent oxidoreductase (luciferase family)
MKRIATVSPVRGCSVEDLRALASETEEAGFEAIFSPELPPYSAIANAQVFAEVTSKIKIGTWITNIYMRRPVMCAAEALTVQEISGGRMVLGVGVSHKPVNERFGIDMGDPIEEMRKYVLAVRSFADGSSPLLTIKREIAPFPIYISGLTERAAELAGEVADGFMPNLATPDHIRKLTNAVRRGAEKAGRSPQDIEITNGIYSFISDDLESAYRAAASAFVGYARLPFYQRLFRNVGFEDIVDKIRSGVEPSEAFTQEFLDTMALIGPEERCRKKLEKHREAGVGLPVIVPYPVGKQSHIEVMKRTTRTFSE